MGTPRSFLVIFVRLLQSLRLVHQLHFDTLGIRSVFNTLSIIPSEFLYTSFTLAHFTYTGWYTKCVGSRFVGTPVSCLVH